MVKNSKRLFALHAEIPCSAQFVLKIEIETVRSFIELALSNKECRFEDMSTTSVDLQNFVEIDVEKANEGSFLRHFISKF